MEQLVRTCDRSEGFEAFPQESFGAEVAESCTNLALDRFFETMNAFMAPLLNAPGLVTLYADGGVIELEVPAEPGMEQRTCRGNAEIEALFEELAEVMLSMTVVETSRKVTGREVFWSGLLHGVHRALREPVKLDALFRLEFEEHDHVIRQWTRLTPAGTE